MKIRKVSYMLALITLFSATTPMASDSNNGRKIYQKHCAMCHGQNGTSVMAGAPDFNRARGLFQSDRSLLERIQAGKNACPAYRGILTEQKIFDVIAYIRTF